MLLVILGIAGFNGVHTDICKNPDPYRILAQVVARCGKATKQKKATVHHKCCTLLLSMGGKCFCQSINSTAKSLSLGVLSEAVATIPRRCTLQHLRLVHSHSVSPGMAAQ